MKRKEKELVTIHNHEVAGSSPALATKKGNELLPFFVPLLHAILHIHNLQ